MTAHDSHSAGPPDDVIVIIYTALTLGLVLTVSLLGLLVKIWLQQAEPSVRLPEPTPVVGSHH